MAAKKTAGCKHLSLLMVAYLPSRQGHTAAHWCPECGAMCWRSYARAGVVDTWERPQKTKRPR